MMASMRDFLNGTAVYDPADTVTTWEGIADAVGRSVEWCRAAARALDGHRLPVKKYGNKMVASRKAIQAWYDALPDGWMPMSRTFAGGSSSPVDE